MIQMYMIYMYIYIYINLYVIYKSIDVGSYYYIQIHTEIVSVRIYACCDVCNAC